MGSIVRTQRVILRSQYVCTYTHALANSDKRGHEFAGEQGAVYGNVLREQREGRNM